MRWKIGISPDGYGKFGDPTRPSRRKIVGPMIKPRREKGKNRTVYSDDPTGLSKEQVIVDKQSQNKCYMYLPVTY